jgi:hypothetical protein
LVSVSKVTEQDTTGFFVIESYLIGGEPGPQTKSIGDHASVGD